MNVARMDAFANIAPTGHRAAAKRRHDATNPLRAAAKRRRDAVTKRCVRSGALAAALCALGVVLIRVPEALADAPGKTAPLSVEAAIAALHARDPGEVDRAIGALGERGGRSAVRALGEFLSTGQPDALTERALSALGKTRSLEALPYLREYTRHRRSGARLAAYAATAAMPGTAAEALLAAGLRDSEPSVRGLCATRLAERGAKGQLELLFRALERGVPEAGGAIGRLGDARVGPRLHAELGKLPIQVLLDAYQALLRRDDIDEATKLDIVARLGEVASPSVKQFLLQMLAEVDRGNTRLRQALSDTAKRIDDRPAKGAAK